MDAKMMWYGMVILISGMLASCTRASDASKVNLNSLDTLKPEKKQKNVWIKTRIHHGSWLTHHYEIQPWYDKSMVLEHAWFHHQPHAMDDQFWYDTYICIADTAKIEPMKIYTVPSELIMVKAMAGGAWSGKHEYYNISGNIRFEVFRKNVVVMSALLKGTINSSRDTCYTESVFSAQTIFLEKGRSGWEYYEEKHDADDEALFRLAGIKKERIDQ